MGYGQMLNKYNKDGEFIWFISLAIIIFITNLAIWGGIIWLVIHFAMKYW